MESNIIDKLRGVASANAEKMIESNSDDELILNEISSYYGDAKSDSELNIFQNSEKPFLISIIGFPSCGKSTFVSSIFHLCMAKGHIGKYKFIDSDTLIGFEKRSLIRKLELETENRSLRTKVYENGFLSLSFLNEKNQVKKIVLSDKSGETYSNYKDQEGEATNDIGLLYSDMYIFLVDGSKLLASKINEIKRFTTLITRFMNGGLLKDNLRLYIVVNKKDLCKVQMDELKETVDLLKRRNDDYIPNAETTFIQSLFLPDDEDDSLENFVDGILDIVFTTNSHEQSMDIDWVNKLLN